MAPDRQVAAAYRQLRPYCDSLPDGQVQSLDDGFNAGEPYYSLSWLIADILENNIAVPQDVLLDAYALLDDEDKEEYAGLIERDPIRRDMDLIRDILKTVVDSDIQGMPVLSQ